MVDIAYIALGSNLGDRAQHLSDARERIRAIPGVIILHATMVEETAPIGPIDQSAYFNQMLAVQTDLTPRELLGHLHAIEREGGRERTVRWGPRTIDLDIVTYAQTTWNEPDLQVPHRELPHRDFWQRELALLTEHDSRFPESVEGP